MNIARKPATLISRFLYRLARRKYKYRVDKVWRRLGYGMNILWRRPLIVLAFRMMDQPLGPAHFLAQAFGQLRAVILLVPSWSLELHDSAKKLAVAARKARAENERHEIVVLCANGAEQKLLYEAGEKAIIANHNIFISERIFVPQAGARPEFDAIYNARFADWKRHHLAREIPRVLYVGYAQGEEETRRIISEITSRSGHQLLNRLDARAMPISISAEKVNAAYNRAAVGLCLSEAEGAMFSSMEYMLAGLPVVSTASKGGRDIFFDPDYCLVVEPDANAIARAVDTLRRREIPRDHVRTRTLAKIEPQRRDFLELLNGILQAHGSPERLGPGWPFHDAPKMPQFKSFNACLDELIEAEGKGQQEIQA